MKNKCKVRLGFFAALMLVCIFISSPKYFPALICSVTIHELGHVFAAKFRKIALYELRLGIFGAALAPKSTLYSYADEIILCLGGPLFNLLSAFAASRLLSGVDMFIMSSLALGSLNLLPIIGFDGGRIFSSVLCMLFSPRTAERILKMISFIFIFILWSFSLYLLIRTGASLTAFVFSVSLFAKIFLPQAT